MLIDASGQAPKLVPPDKARYSREHVGSEYIGWLHFQPIWDQLRAHAAGHVGVSASIRPFRLEVPQAAIDELHARLDRIRWPDEAPDAPWAYGTSLAFMREFVHDWRTATTGAPPRRS